MVATKTIRRNSGSNRAGLAKRNVRTVNGNVRGRNWCFTLNNPTDAEKESLETMGENLSSGIKYIVWQEEEGESDGTIHLQGYVEFSAAKSMQTVKNNFGTQRLHLGIRMASAAQAARYCKKRETRVDGGHCGEYGTISKQGRRRGNMDNVVNDIRDGADMAEIRKNYPGQSVTRGNMLIKEVLRCKGVRSFAPSRNNVHIYVGESGSGKTVTAKRMATIGANRKILDTDEKNDAFYGAWPTGGRWWWNGYEGQQKVVFDEFRENISYQQALKLFGNDPWTVEWKGDMGNMCSEQIIVTSVRDPKEWYKKVEDKSELQRRIKENCTIFDFNGDGSFENGFSMVPRNMDDFEFETFQHGSDSVFSAYGANAGDTF